MADLERLAAGASDGITRTVRRLAKLAAGIIVGTATVGAATFATGWWVFEGCPTWLVVGGAICIVPVAAAAIGWFLVLRTMRALPRLLDDIRSYLRTSGTTSGVLIDHDSGVALGAQARSFSSLRGELMARRRELPALYAGVRTISTVPALVAISVLGLFGVGALGTVLLIGALID